MGDSDEAKYLRDNFIIKIIPMINVDGVICGNSRTSLSGCDLNRRWIIPNEYLHPEIYYLKELIKNFSKKKKIEYIIDFHGHFGAFNSFFYANNNKENINYCRLFPYICGKASKIIQFDKSVFKMPKYKKGTGRIDLYGELNIENIVTLETSYFGCNAGDYNKQYFTIDTLKEIGRDICNGILLSHYNSYMKKDIIEINIKNLNENYKKTIENKLININCEFEEYISGLKNKINENKNNYKNLDNTNTNKELEINENENENESDSESEPSRDNLDEEEIKVLLPFFKKRKNFKKKYKNISMLKNLNILKKSPINSLKNNNVPVHQNKVSSFPKIDNNNQTSINKNSKILNVNHLLINNLRKQNINFSNRLVYKNRNNKIIPLSINNLNSNKHSIIVTIKMEDKQTQTEDKFFKLHWSTFLGTYKIISAKYEEKKNDSFSFLCFEKQTYRNNLFRNSNNNIPLTLTSFNHFSCDKKNESQQMSKRSLNNNNIVFSKKIDVHDRNSYLTKYNKRNHNFSYSCEQIIKENNKRNNNKDNKNKSIQKVIKSFISNITTLSKNDFLQRYLNNEDRINEYEN